MGSADILCLAGIDVSVYQWQGAGHAAPGRGGVEHIIRCLAIYQDHCDRGHEALRREGVRAVGHARHRRAPHATSATTPWSLDSRPTNHRGQRNMHDAAPVITSSLSHLAHN